MKFGFDWIIVSFFSCKQHCQYQLLLFSHPRMSPHHPCTSPLLSVGEGLVMELIEIFSLSYFSQESAAFYSRYTLHKCRPWIHWNMCTHSHKQAKTVLMCPHFLPLSSHTHTHTQHSSLYVRCPWELELNAPSAPAPDTQTAFIPNEGLMNFLKGSDGPNWSWYVPSGWTDGAIGWRLSHCHVTSKSGQRERTY